MARQPIQVHIFLYRQNGAEYEYVVLPKADSEKAQNMLDNPDYVVMKKDSVAHIVKNTKKPFIA